MKKVTLLFFLLCFYINSISFTYNNNTFLELYLYKYNRIENLYSKFNLDKDFLNKTINISDSLDIKPEWLLIVFAIETGDTFNPAIQNKLSKATGLIQFLPSTIKSYDSNIEELKQMSCIQQLELIFKYYKRIIKWKGKISTLEDTYFAVHAPSLVNASSNKVVYRQGTLAYTFNKSNDNNNDGLVLKKEISYKVIKKFNKYFKNV